MSQLIKVADENGNRMVIAGMALATVADLLGCDGCDHNLSPDQVNGLHHAVGALAELVKVAGYELCVEAEEGAV